jgi:molybdopterin-containing oxidoreductase family iron-sulfur binding subunit
MTPPRDLAALRERLRLEHGPRFWRTLEELADTDELRQLLETEFPRYAAVWPEGVSRRSFLSIMAASLALAGLGGCAAPPGETIVPYVRTPEQLVPGKPLYYATAAALDGFATGVLVESHEGRPTKIEGNPGHPASGGATDLFSQASILTLYDPDRARAVTEHGQVRQYEDFVRALRAALAPERARGGAGVRILTGTVTSPTLAAQLRGVLAAFPAARWHQWDPLMSADAARAGARLAFGRDVHTRHRLDAADVVVALDADFLACTPRHLRDTRDFAERRRVAGRATPAMSRLYAVEPALSATGAKADHRLPLRAREVAGFATALAARLGVDVAPLSPALPAGVPPAWLDALARDLLAHRGTSAIVAGDGQPPIVHALAHAMNAALGNVGRTVIHTEPVVADAVDQRASLAQLADDMRAGRVSVLLVLAWNPVYAAPVDLDFGGALQRVAFPAYLGLFADETAVKCRWHVPEAHALESWSDVRAWDGTVSIVQPLIAPLYQGKSAHELLAALGEGGVSTGHDIVRASWQALHRGGDFERFWRRALHDGVVADSAARPVSVAVRAGWASAADRAAVPATRPGLEIVFRASPTLHDGRFANNGWLQELPQPLTHITWDNAAMVSPRTAERLGLAGEDLVELSYRGRTVRAPVWVAPGHADGSVTVPLGYGRTLAGRVGNGVGFDAYALRTSQAPWFDDGLEVRALGRTHPLAVTARHRRLDGRDVVVAGTLAQYERDPAFVSKATHDPARGGGQPPTLYPEYESPGYRWGMSIDLSTCTSCNACVVACYAENNIPVVGKTQVALGRIMHWLRIDTYHAGSADNPETYHQPLPCMHCEKAPCEVVCPVNATVHGSEGLNEMVYNRCVGTRYCSNNCPYKVRSFNFLQYADWQTPSLKLQRNPDVTVRSRGVMEKCTYCVQRINAARIEAEKDGRRIRDGEVLTACQAACPTQAIVFGDLNDPASAVGRLKQSPLDYALLGELGTRPRTTYLAALRNPNPDVPTA